ncbi:hypothetical protein AX760_23195 [Pararhizobium antarcticum]|uniref:AlgX/AlgJ SGNH hydrolase-like domain-containing protein n=2 Tax=Pararhizobium antarcticum TaxID=1798805 RepID=A0A657LMZ6_9HYPH|nr:hypothetical protein AX760_23195 [Pararhizobium antarcticum]OJF96119.1 hypothetical protein AX761_16280 [Rhizobium sp. 58]
MICVLVFGVILTASFTLTFNAKDLSISQYQDVITGKFTSKVESAYEKNVPFHSAAVHLFNAISFNLFGEARTGALVGRDGWLFTTEEFSWSRRSEDNLAAAFERVLEVRSVLKAKGADLVVLPVPAKAAVAANKLGDLILPSRNAGVYDRFRTFLEDKNIRSVDLQRAYDIPGADRLFLVSDTHWSTEGSSVAARTACNEISTLKPLHEMTFEAKTRMEVLHVGDLSKFIDMGWFAPASVHAADRIVGIDAAMIISDADSLFADSTHQNDPAIPLALVGTSYSANSTWSFEDHLKLACGMDVLNYSQEGRGPFEPMSAFLKTIEKGPIAPIVVWEIPVRYLDDLDRDALRKTL